MIFNIKKYNCLLPTAYCLLPTAYCLLTSVALFFSLSAKGQFPPPAGQEGSTAIHKDSSVFVGWATGCEVVRGPMKIDEPELGDASAGTPDMAIGKAGEDGTVSFGDGGYAILTFDYPIINGEGYDFAVFENAFDDEFLELGYVEVSSDGINYVRFPSVSLTQTDEQIGSFGSVDATKVHNLAGKYRLFYGTPFDLEELKDTPGLDVNNITHIKIIDAVGNIDDTYARYDSEGNKINFPWPTPFESGGFDLDAVGVIHHDGPGVGVVNVENRFLSLYPNPTKGQLTVENFGSQAVQDIRVLNQQGIPVQRISGAQTTRQHINLHQLASGIYFIQLIFEEGVEVRKIVIE